MRLCFARSESKTITREREREREARYVDGSRETTDKLGEEKKKRNIRGAFRQRDIVALLLSLCCTAVFWLFVSIFHANRRSLNHDHTRTLRGERHVAIDRSDREHSSRRKFQAARHSLLQQFPRTFCLLPCLCLDHPTIISRRKNRRSKFQQVYTNSREKRATPRSILFGDT